MNMFSLNFFHVTMILGPYSLLTRLKGLGDNITLSIYGHVPP